MKIFEKNEKINFVDDNNVLVGFDYELNCCEDFGYQLTEIIPSSFNRGNNGIDPDKYQFDTNFFKSLSNLDTDEGGAVLFKLDYQDKSIYLTLRNSHNGYYSHGFKMLKDNEIITKGDI